jgi:hypothetical protein
VPAPLVEHANEPIKPRCLLSSQTLDFSFEFFQLKRLIKVTEINLGESQIIPPHIGTLFIRVTKQAIQVVQQHVSLLGNHRIASMKIRNVVLPSLSISAQMEKLRVPPTPHLNPGKLRPLSAVDCRPFDSVNGRKHMQPRLEEQAEAELCWREVAVFLCYVQPENDLRSNGCIELALL